MDLIGIAQSTVKIILILGLPSLIVSMIIGRLILCISELCIFSLMELFFLY
jgi:flagellar biosynthetic protein FliQ